MYRSKMWSAFEGDFEIGTLVLFEMEEGPVDELKEYSCLLCGDRQKELMKRGSRYLIGGILSSDKLLIFYCCPYANQLGNCTLNAYARVWSCADKRIV